MESIPAAAVDVKKDRSGSWTVGKLFRRRVIRFIHEQWRVLRTALDWSVWLYIVIPGLWIGGGLYVELWRDPPFWLAHMPLWVGERVALIVVLAGNLRTFAEEADVLFLLQRKEWGRGLTLRGMGYTAVILTLFTALIYAFLLPFLITMHGLTIGSVVGLCLITMMWALIGVIWRNLIEGRYRGWRKWAWKLAAAIVLGATYILPVVLLGEKWQQLLGPAGAGFLVLLALMRLKLRARDTFDSDVQQENKARLAITGLLLRGVIERKPRIRLNRPMIFRQSNRIFKTFDAESILAEAALKSFLRRFSLLRIWFSFTLLSVLAVVLSPGGLKLLIIAVFPILLSLWAQSHWRNVLAEAFVSQFQWPDHVLMQSAERIRFWVVVPAALFMGLAAGLQMYGLAGLLLIVPAVVVWMGINKFLSTFLMLRIKEEKS